MKLRIKKITIYLFIGLFLLFLLSFNISLNATFFGINGIYVCIIVSVICILLYQNNDGELSLMRIKVNKLYVAIWGTLLIPILFNNQDIARDKIIYFMYYLIIIIWGFTLGQKHGWEKLAWRIIQLFCLIHFVAGLFLLANKNFLLNNILPLFQINEDTYILLIKAIDNGYMTGLCYHYSTMGMYMSIGTIAFSGVLFQNKNYKLREVFIFITFLVGLVITGKRGPLLFTIIALIIAVLVTREKQLTKKQLLRKVSVSFILLVAFIVAYINVPQLKQVIERFAVGNDDLNELSSGRIDYFWTNAITMFGESPIWGHGWRSFKYIGVGTLNANDAHNIYLQLLVEVGLVGFTLVMFFMIFTLLTTYKTIRNNKTITHLSNANISILKAAFAYQIFFLLYGTTGNPLYDPQCYFPYIVCCAIGYSAMNRVHNSKK